MVHILPSRESDQSVLKAAEIKRDKLDKKVEPGVFIGYSLISKTYRVFQPDSKKIIISRDVSFMENEEWSLNWSSEKKKSGVDSQRPIDLNQDELIDDPDVRGSRWFTYIYQRCNVVVLEPAGYSEAEKDPYWLAAMQDELSMIEKNQTWELVERQDTTRMLLAIAAHKQWKIHQLDIKSAILNGFLDEEIYVDQPEGFVVEGQENKVYQLIKALYELKQAPRACNIELIQKFKEDVMQAFEMADLGEMSYFLGIEIKQSQETHFKAAKRVLRYTKGTLSFEIKFCSSRDFELQGYVDSDWAGSLDDLKSTFEFCFCFGSRIFTWSSKKQEIIVQSTAEAELIATTVAINHALWIRKIMCDLQMEQALK
ncbi:hypothetical protein AgCh_018556 [Apium graveolens]